MKDFTTIANNVGVMYALVLVIFLLMYIAFWKKPSDHKRSQRQ